MSIRQNDNVLHKIRRCHRQTCTCNPEIQLDDVDVAPKCMADGADQLGCHWHPRDLHAVQEAFNEVKLTHQDSAG
jgi:hypothetical protein